MQNTHFSGLTRKNPVFERSVLKYVSIKNRILTPSGQKSRVCVNQPDRLLPPFRVEIHFCLSLLTQPEGNLLKKKGWRQREKTEREKEKKENFYHGILLGLLGYKANWLIKSNAESGTGYSDILVEVPNNRTGIVIELKYAGNGDLDAACAEALKQMEEKSYVDKLKQDGMRNFIKYGIACFKKDCRVVIAG